MKKLLHRPFSIRTVLLFVFSFVITIMVIVMATAISFTMENFIQQNASQASQQLISQTQFTLNKFFLRINASLQTLAQTPALIEMCQYSNGDTDSDNLKNREEVQQQILNQLRNQDDIANIIVLGKEFTVYHTDLNSAPLMKSPLIQELLESIDNQKYVTITYHPISYPTYYNTRSTELEMPVSILVRDYSKYDTTNYGVVLAGIKVKTLDDFFMQLQTGNGYTAFILDESETIYYSSDEDMIGEDYNSYLENHGIVSQSEQYFLDSSGKRQLFEVSLPLNLNNWKLVLVSDMSAIHSQVNWMRFTVFGIGVITLAFFIFLIYFLTRRITAPLTVLSKQMETMDDKALSQKMSSSYFYKEIKQLYTGYNQMLDRIESLINEVYYEQLRQKDAQYEALQAKINPHFLYNTLQSISSLAVLGRTDDIEIVTNALGGMLEYLTYEKNAEVFLSRDLEYIKSYVQIQQLRYNNKFITTYEISPISLRCKISKLLLQPMVENAIKHGLEQKQAGGRLIIRTSIQDGLLFIEVEDNGVGMDSETLEKVMWRIHNPNKNSSKKSIGLSNVQERIHLKYGSQYGIEIQSLPNQGTNIKVTIPAVFSEL